MLGNVTWECCLVKYEWKLVGFYSKVNDFSFQQKKEKFEWSKNQSKKTTRSS